MLKIIKLVKKQVYVSEHTQNNNLSKLMPPNLCGCSGVVCLQWGSPSHHHWPSQTIRWQHHWDKMQHTAQMGLWPGYSVLLLAITKNLTRSNLKEGVHISSWSKNKVYCGQEGTAQGSLLSSEWIRNQRKQNISVQLVCKGSTACGMVPPPLSMGLPSVKSH